MPRSRTPRCRRDGGQTTPLLGLLLAAMLGGLLLLTQLGQLVGDRARAQTAADAAALAGAAEGEDVARDVADRNGGRLAAFTVSGVAVQVRVVVGRAEAWARAERSWPGPTAGPAG